MSADVEMDILTIDAEEMRDAARRLLTDKVDRRIPYAEPPGDLTDPLYASMAELGWPLLTIAPEQGGLGQPFAVLAPIYEEMGRAVSPVVLAPSLAALEVLGTCDSVAVQALVARIGTGEARVAVVFPPAESLDVEQGGSRLTGNLRNILADSGSTHLLVLGSSGIHLLDLAGAGVTVTSPELWDRSRKLIDVRLDHARSDLILPGNPVEAAARVRAHIDLALAWDSLGGARQILEETIGYMMTRTQFNRPIGSFQALKHRAADHQTAIEVASAYLRSATSDFSQDLSSAWSKAGQARLLADEAYRSVAEDAVQLHGGIGFTWEHDCHLFLKRATLNEMLYETPEARRDRLAPAILDRALKGHF